MFARPRITGFPVFLGIHGRYREYLVLLETSSTSIDVENPSW
jgi:hypothetical protein